ncbi:unnamed protein product [Didymodactylos carnosus]|uniref:Uncharacterized protein n=1 Tax=Didymodactylos carnosus TaxID=1234261 RepID=A0A8S2DMI5_9BILA|nr:unnamed protein product [Didymodactylos carnosus]CAF3751158.1 unnamed protein product [Didymodactylos carnosus]
MFVCKQWYRILSDVRKWRLSTFYSSFSDSPPHIHWRIYDTPLRLNITPRFNHAVCYVDSYYMYVFGGNRDILTTLNDFWRFDISTRMWERILATGTYPPPKSAATFIEFEQQLYLYGGKSMIHVDDVHVRQQQHSELHIYSLDRNCWYLQSSINDPGGIADHSASVLNRSMIVFGGLLESRRQKSNELYEYKFDEKSWTKVDVNGVKPEPRQGQSQCTYNNDYILIIGGCIGVVNPSSSPARAVWLFCYSVRQWTQITVQNFDFCPEEIASIPTCILPNKQYAVTFGRCKRIPSIQTCLKYSQYDFSTSRITVEQEEHPHSLVRLIPSSSSDECSSAGEEQQNTTTSTSSACLRQRGKPSIRFNASKNREKQLLSLQRMEDRLKTLRTHPYPTTQLPTNKPSTVEPRHQQQQQNYNLFEVINGLQMFVLDLRNVITDRTCQWKPISTLSVLGSPRSVISYSLICARSELILFGGVETKRTIQHQTLHQKGERPKPSKGCLCFITSSQIAL